MVKLKSRQFILFIEIVFQKNNRKFDLFLKFFFLSYSTYYSFYRYFFLILFCWSCVFVCSTTSSLLVIIQYLSYFVLSIVLCSCCVRGQRQFATCPVFPLFSFTDLLIITVVISSISPLDLVINSIHLI